MSSARPLFVRRLPQSPGVYLMKGASGEVLYVGKAANLKRRVSSYFGRPHDRRIERLLRGVRRVDHKKTETALEALILEAKLIKKYQPPFNVLEKDDKSFLYVGITREKFPRVLLIRGKEAFAGARYGPFLSAASVREALRILRRIFPWSVHEPDRVGKFDRPCFDFEVGLCPGTCLPAGRQAGAGKTDRREYLRNIRNLKLIFEGKRKRIVSALRKEMTAASRRLEFEKAATIRRQIFGLEHIQDIALIRDDERDIITSPPEDFRIEGYDVSNISGTSAVGAMVVFEGREPKRGEYRKFRIRTVRGADDVGMLREVMERRVRNSWPLPALVLVDGGKGQVNAVQGVLRRQGLVIPVLGIAKGPSRKRNDFYGKIPEGVGKATLVAVRDEAHRFAVAYHRKVRRGSFLGHAHAP